MPRPVPQQPMHVPAGLAMDQATRSELLDVGRANVLNENVRQDERGALTKRLAYAAQSATRLDSTTRTAGKRMFSLGSTPCVVDGHFVDIVARTPAVNITKDRVPECLVTRVPVPWAGFNPQLTTLTYCNGYYVVLVYAGSAALKFTLFVVDAATNAIVSGPFTVTGVTNYPKLPHVVAVGTTAIVIYATGTNTLSGRTISLANAAGINTGWSSATSLLTDANQLGVDVHGYEDRFAVAYSNTSGGASRLSVKTFSAALANLETVTINTSSTNVAAVGLAGSNADTLWVGWCQATDVRVVGLDANNLAVTLATAALLHSFATNAPIVIGIVVTGTGTGRLVATESSTAISIARSFLTNAGAVNADGAAQSWFSTQWLSRPFRIDGRNYATACFCDPNAFDQNTQSTHFIVDIDATASLRVVGNISPRLAENITEGALQHVALVSSTKVGIGHVVSRTGGLGIGQGRAVEIAIADFASTNRFQTVPFAGYGFMTGGATCYFDGHRLRESNFFIRPEAPAAGAGAGTGVTGTSIRYIAVPEKFDAQGNCEMGAPSDPSGPVSPTNDSVDVQIRTLPFSNQTDGSSTDAENPIRFAVYRSGDNGANPYYRCGTVDNSTSAETVTFSDTTTDVTVNAVLYSQPGQVGTAQPRACPPGFHHVVAYGDIVVGVGDDLTTLWHSGGYLPGEGVWFADVFQRTITEDGPVTAMAVQDGTIYVFKRRSIFALTGETPSDNGAVGGLGTPRKLASTVGAAQTPTCVSSLGIWFVSERGIELLSRSGDVQWVGEPIQATVAEFPVAMAIALDEEHSLVIVSLTDGVTGKDAVFDLTINSWVSEDTKKGTSASEYSVDACQLEVAGVRRYAWLGSNGVVWYQKLPTDADAYLDGSDFVVASYTMPPWKMGLAQEQRAYEFMLTVERHSAAGLTVEVARDFGSFAPAETMTWAEAATSGQRRLPFRPKPLTSAIQFRVSDTAPAVLGTGRGFTFVGMSADIAPKQGTTRGTPRTATSLRR